jgi:hypothetical protein
MRFLHTITMSSILSVVFFASLCIQSVSSFPFQYDASSFTSANTIVRDVAIIGGGASGTHAAISLKNSGKSVIVIEKKARLGGHTETYTDPSTGVAQDYGVVVYHNNTIVRDFFARFDIPLTEPNHNGPVRENYDFTTGKPVNITSPTPEAIGAGLQEYATFLAQYPDLDRGTFLPDPIPADLTLPFGAFATKYGLEAVIQTLFSTNQGAGDFLSLPVVENARVGSLSLIQQLAANSLLTTARHNNSELYGKATTELLSSTSLLLSSEVLSSARKSSGVELIVSTPSGKQLIKAKKLLITIPPRLEFLAPFNPTKTERAVFSKLIDVGYYAALVKNTGIPDDLFLYNYAPSTPYNLPVLPGVYLMQPTSIPGVKAIYYGSQRSGSTYPLSDSFVKGEIVAGIKRLQAANPGTFKKTEPELVVYTSHAPFYVQTKPADIKAGIYDDMNALQGVQSTYWTGAAWRAQDSSMLWKYNEEVVLPMVLEGL